MGIEVTSTPGKIYTNQTGRFQVTSVKGIECVFVLYCYESNTILTEPLKESTGKSILRTYKIVLDE